MIKYKMEITELNNELKTGNTYRIKSGEYPTAKITITSSGTAEYPIHIVAEDVIISNNSVITIQGSFIIFEGFTFRNVNINKMVNIRGDYIVFRNNVFEGMKKDVERIVSVTGQYCRLMDNRFTFFDKQGCLIVVEHKEDKPAFCMIDGNSFNDRREGNGNGCEIIRLGDSKSSLWESKTIIHNNQFNICNGEIEIVSVKSCKNVIHNNKFFNSKGGLCLRHGRDNLVVYNFFNGGGQQGSAGLRLTGKGHRVYYNTFQNLEDEEPFRSALSIMCGEVNNELNGYEPVENVEVKFNDFINCRDVMSIGVDNKRKSNVKPKKLIITNNRIIKCVDLFNMSDKVLGYDDSIVTDNPILKYDQKLMIKLPMKNEKVNIGELWEKLYNMIEDEIITTKDDKQVEDEKKQNEQEKEDISKIVINKIEKVSSGIVEKDEDEELKYPEEEDKNQLELILEEMKNELKETINKSMKRLEVLEKITYLLK